jgi:glycosyltransferase involved in cell wall biosynthesis
VEPTKIVYLLEGLKYGGVQQGVLMQASRLDREKYDVEVWSLRSGKSNSELAPEFERRGIKVGLTPVGHYNDQAGIFGLARRLQEEQIDLLATQSFYPNMIGRIAARIAQTPVVIAHYHSTYDHHWNRTMVLYERILMRDTQAFICVSKAVKEYLQNLIGLPEDRTRIVHNCVDVKRFDLGRDRKELRKKLDLPQDVPIIAMVGRLTQVKDIPTFIKAIPFVRMEYPKALFLLVGDGEDREELHNLVGLSALSKAIRFLGARQDVPEILNAVDCVALPSLVEGFPRVLLECFASRTPIVATPAGGVTELLRHGQNGLQIPFSDPESLAQAVLRTLRAPEETAGRCAKAFRDVQAFDQANWIRKTEKIFDRLIAEQADQIDERKRSTVPASGFKMRCRLFGFRWQYRKAWLTEKTKI